MMIGPTSSVW